MARGKGRREVDVVGDEGAEDAQKAPEQNIGADIVSAQDLGKNGAISRMVHVVLESRDGNVRCQCDPDTGTGAAEQARLQWSGPSQAVAAVDEGTVAACDPKREPAETAKGLRGVAGRFDKPNSA